MNLVIIDGYLGAGKTLAMTLLMQYFQSLSGCTLYSNYGVTGSKEFTHYKDFQKIAFEPSSIVGLDEAHTDLDSRNFSTNAVKFFTHLIFYLRKLRCTLMLATPSIDNLDGRVRSISNLYIHVTKDKKYFRYDMYDIQADRFLKQYKIRKEDAFLCASLAYNTYNMVLPVTFPDDRKEFHSFVSELKSTSDLYYQQESLAGGIGSPDPLPQADMVDVLDIYSQREFYVVKFMDGTIKKFRRVDGDVA